MHPVFHVGPLDFPAYFTMLMVGYTIVVLLASREAERVGMNGARVIDLGLIMLVAGLVGARALHVVVDGYWPMYRDLCVDPLAVKGERLPENRKCATDEQCWRADKGDLCDPSTGTCHVKDCFRVFKFWYGGLVYYGGLLLAVPIGFWFLHRHRMPRWKVADLGGFGIPLGIFFGRIGCFLAGCCFGKTCPNCHGTMAFPRGSPAWQQQVDHGVIARSASHALPVFPTQLWEALACLAIFLYTYFWLWRGGRKRFDGQVFFVFLAQYAVVRFVIEFWRDDPRGVFFGLSTSQWLGIPLFLAAAAGYLWLRTRKAGPASPGNDGP